jgi:ParB-like chromosome segregation protein Spo0J
MNEESQKILIRLRKAILACAELPEAERVAAFNAGTAALRSIVSDLSDDPVTSVRLVASESVVANAYNPNRVANVEMELLKQSIEADGVTMPVVVVKESDLNVVVDGFHRQKVLKSLGRKYIPVSTIDKPVGDRMASTVRHNRARGKHQVDLQAELVKGMIELGMSDSEVALKLGMSIEELLRLKQIVGAAKLLAGVEYSASYGRDDEPDISDE